jgi:hypothetical protein
MDKGSHQVLPVDAASYMHQDKQVVLPSACLLLLDPAKMATHHWMVSVFMHTKPSPSLMDSKEGIVVQYL